MNISYIGVFIITLFKRFIDSDTDTYQTYAFTIFVWALNFLIIIISLTCLLINDPIIYLDSEAYKEYLLVRKKAEENLNKVTIIVNIRCTPIHLDFNIYREIKKLQFLSSLDV